MRVLGVKRKALSDLVKKKAVNELHTKTLNDLHTKTSELDTRQQSVAHERAPTYAANIQPDQNGRTLRGHFVLQKCLPDRRKTERFRQDR